MFVNDSAEFCVLFHKLKSTCNTYKNVTFSRRYPGLCDLVIIQLLTFIFFKQDWGPFHKLFKSFLPA